MSSPQVQGDHAIATVYYAPELPSGVLEKIMAPLKGNVQALCTACSLNKDFGKAAAEPSVWRSLTCFERKRSSSGHLRGMLRVTDKRLAALVRRSRGELAELDVQRCDLITARGVAAALEGCSKVRCLRIKGVLGVPGDVNVLPVLRNSLLRASDYWNRGFLDVRNYVLCNCNSKAGGLCARLGHVACEECSVNICSGCEEHYKNKTSLCRHMCCACFGTNYGHLLSRCPACTGAQHYCPDCLWWCDNDVCTVNNGGHGRWCMNHGEYKVVYCDSCGKCYCESCAFGDWQLCDECSEVFCETCIAEQLMSREEWLDVLEARDGDDAVDAETIRRLLEAADLEAADAEDDDQDDEEEEEDGRCDAEQHAGCDGRCDAEQHAGGEEEKEEEEDVEWPMLVCEACATKQEPVLSPAGGS